MELGTHQAQLAGIQQLSAGAARPPVWHAQAQLAQGSQPRENARTWPTSGVCGANGYERLGQAPVQRIAKVEPRWDVDWLDLANAELKEAAA